MDVVFSNHVFARPSFQMIVYLIEMLLVWGGVGNLIPRKLYVVLLETAAGAAGGWHGLLLRTSTCLLSSRIKGCHICLMPLPNSSVCSSKR